MPTTSSTGYMATKEVETKTALSALSRLHHIRPLVSTNKTNSYLYSGKKIDAKSKSKKSGSWIVTPINQYVFV